MLYRLYSFLLSRIGKSRISRLKRELYSLGKNVDIDLDTVFINPAKISIGENCKIFKGVYIKSRTGNALGVEIGKNVKIHEYSYIDDYGGSIHIDDFAGIGHHCVIGGHGNLHIGKYTIIAGLTYIVPANHKFDNATIPFVNQGERKKGINIGDNVWIGAGCIILDGVTIGHNSVIAAGSIVTKDIPNNVLAMGQPAVVKRTIA